MFHSFFLMLVQRNIITLISALEFALFFFLPLFFFFLSLLQKSEEPWMPWDDYLKDCIINLILSLQS